MKISSDEFLCVPWLHIDGKCVAMYINAFFKLTSVSYTMIRTYVVTSVSQLITGQTYLKYSSDIEFETYSTVRS